MCPDSLNWTLWVRFHGRYWYQSFIDGSNIWSVDRIDPWGPEMDHPPLGRSYLVVESSCYMAMLIVTWEISSSAAAKYELYILLPADQRCSKKCVAALQADTFVYLYIYIYIYIYKDYSVVRHHWNSILGKGTMISFVYSMLYLDIWMGHRFLGDHRWPRGGLWRKMTSLYIYILCFSVSITYSIICKLIPSYLILALTPNPSQ